MSYSEKNSSYDTKNINEEEEPFEDNNNNNNFSYFKQWAQSIADNVKNIVNDIEG